MDRNKNEIFGDIEQTVTKVEDIDILLDNFIESNKKNIAHIVFRHITSGYEFLGNVFHYAIIVYKDNRVTKPQLHCMLLQITNFSCPIKIEPEDIYECDIVFDFGEMKLAIEPKVPGATSFGIECDVVFSKDMPGLLIYNGNEYIGYKTSFEDTDEKQRSHGTTSLLSDREIENLKRMVVDKMDNVVGKE